MSGKAAKPAAAAKALKAAKGARVGISKKTTVKRTKVHFYRPKTKLGGAQEQSYVRTLPQPVKRDRISIIKKPWASDAAMKQIEDHNTLVFIVDPRSTRTQIKYAVQKVRALFETRARGREKLPVKVAQSRGLRSALTSSSPLPPIFIYPRGRRTT